MAILISYLVSARDPDISPRAFGPRVDIGRGLMQGMISKWPYHNLFIIYLKIKRTVCSITLILIHLRCNDDLYTVPVAN